MFLSFLAVVIVLAWIYILWGREWLVARWPTQFKWWHEQVEDKLWEKSRTVLVGRLYWLGGLVLLAHDLAAEAGLDVTPVLTQLGDFIPEKYRPVALALFLYLTGLAIVKLRKMTSKPLGE